MTKHNRRYKDFVFVDRFGKDKKTARRRRRRSERFSIRYAASNLFAADDRFVLQFEAVLRIQINSYYKSAEENRRKDNADRIRNRNTRLSEPHEVETLGRIAQIRNGYGGHKGCGNRGEPAAVSVRIIRRKVSRSRPQYDHCKRLVRPRKIPPDDAVFDPRNAITD